MLRSTIRIQPFIDVQLTQFQNRLFFKIWFDTDGQIQSGTLKLLRCLSLCKMVPECLGTSVVTLSKTVYECYFMNEEDVISENHHYPPHIVTRQLKNNVL